MTEPRMRYVEFAQRAITVVEQPSEIEDCPGCGFYKGIQYESIDLDKDRKPDLFCTDDQCVIFAEKYRSQAARFLSRSPSVKLPKYLGNEDQKKKADQMFVGVVEGGLALFAEFKSAVTQGKVTVETRSFLGSPSATILFRGHQVFLDRLHSGSYKYDEAFKKLPIHSVAIVDYSTRDEYQYTMYRYKSPAFFEPIQKELRALEAKDNALGAALWKEWEQKSRKN